MQERLLLLLLLLLVHSSTANTQLVQVSEMLREHDRQQHRRVFSADWQQQITDTR